jgi:AraC-like DNA-binding protein
MISEPLVRRSCTPPTWVGFLQLRAWVVSASATATEAAHAAGFADSAHFTRTARTMNGFTPTKMPFGRWLTNCR